MSSLEIRNERLAELSKMIIDGHIVHKLDSIATIFINGKFYFNVFRRYNSPYNIVIEDHNLDLHYHQDHTIRTSLKTILCLPDYEASNIYTWNVTSYKHNGPVPSLDRDIADMRWSEVQAKYNAISVNFGGIFYNISGTPLMPTACVSGDIPSTPRAQMIPNNLEVPGAPERPIKKEVVEAANTLLSISIPPMSNDFHMSETDGPTLSMRFTDIMNRKAARHPISCYCQMDDDDNSDYDDSDYDDESNHYTILRSGTMIPKVTSA
jgi:hypothetical protein